jgi:GntR family transcriptional regulator/GntR family frlABCD operon transcriptional regulator
LKTGTENLPQYKRLYELVRKHIDNGVYKVGDLLPSENELCRLHGLTRPTVRLALMALVNDGYIRKQQGKGSIVADIPKGIGILSVMGTTHALKNKNLKTIMIEKPVIIPWPNEFMFGLSELELESGCLTFKRLRLLDEKPIFYDISYIPNINLPRFTSRNFENKSLLDIMRRAYQVEVKGGEQKIKALHASSEICQYLKLECNHPVLHLERKLVTNRPDLNIYSSIYCNTEEYAIYGTF